MDLNYAKWNNVVEEDSSEDSGAEGKRLTGSRWGARGARASDGSGGDDCCMGCGDASCSNCDPDAFSRVLESFPDHVESADFRSMQPPFVKPGPPLAFATPERNSSFMRRMTEGSGCESRQCRHHELAKAAASAVFEEVFRGGCDVVGEKKAQGQGGGTFAEESKEGNRNPKELSISISDAEEARSGEGHVVGAGGNGSDDSDGSDFPSPSEDYDSEDECDYEEGPPALASGSDTDSQLVPQALGPDLYEAYRRARARQKDEKDAGKLGMLAYNFWEEKGDSINPVFANFFEKQVLKGRPVPHADTCLLTNNLPRGFPEFVAFVGAANVDERGENSRKDFPTGFFAYAREAVVQQARARLNGMEAGPSPRRKEGVAEKAEREAGQKSKGPGQMNGTVQSSHDKLEGSTCSTRSALKSSEMKPKRDGKGGSGDCGGAAVASALRRDFKAAAMQRQDMNKIADNLEKKALSSLKKLSLALEREKALHKKELAAERAALMAAREELKAFVGDHSGRVRVLPVREALGKAEALKKRANAVLADTRYPEAVGQYTLGIKVLEPHVKPTRNGKQARHKEEHRSSSGEEDEEGGGDRSDRSQEEEDGGADSVAAKEMLLILLCNRSLAHLKWGNLGSAKADAQQAMDIDPRHIKAYFRRAAAHKQAERYREALSDLRYILRLEPPPAKGAAVSDDILAVQKMARECERKVRETGFKKALEETTNAKLAASALSKKEAREKWDVARRTKGTKKKHKRLPVPPRKAGKSAPVWEHTGENFMLPFSGLPTLKELSASVAAECIDRAPDAYMHWCEGLLSEYLVLVFERLSWVSLRTMMSSGLYDELGIVSSNAQAANWQAQDKQYRRIYAAVDHDAFLRAASEVAASGAIGGGSAAVAGKGAGGKKSNPPPLLPWKVLDPHLGLMDVLENHALFTHQAWDAEEEATPKLFDFNTGHPTGQRRAVVNREEFFQQFNVFTEGQLTFMDWNNVIAAGGSVLASTHPPPPGPLRDFYHTQAYRASDVDLFLYGLDDKAATQKVRQIYASIKLANSKIFAVRTLRAITFVSEFPYRKVQIVLRLYKTLAEVLHGFDVDACSIGFDGHTVWCTNRAARAICKRYNVVDLSRRSPSYENRLFKYSKRGHAVFVRGMKVDKVAPSLTQGSSLRNPHSEQGLAKLICLDRRHRRYNMAQFNSFFERWNLGLTTSPEAHLHETREIHRQEHTPDSDYTHVFIPYGPKWTRDRTRVHVQDYVRAANTMYYRLNLCQNPQAEIQPVVYGTIDHVLEMGVNTGEEEKMVYSHEDEMLVMRMRHVKGDKMWLKVNPGNQGVFGDILTRSGDHAPLLTGSFHPTPCTKEQWERGAYVKGRRPPRRLGGDD